MSRVRPPMTLTKRWVSHSLMSLHNTPVKKLKKQTWSRQYRGALILYFYISSRYYYIFILHISFTNILFQHYSLTHPFCCVLCRVDVKILVLRNVLPIKAIFQVKPFLCRQCAKTFSSQSKLKQHMLVHSEEKPFMCDICERAFNVVSNLRRHMRTVHKESISGPAYPSLQVASC